MPINLCVLLKVVKLIEDNAIDQVKKMLLLEIVTYLLSDEKMQPCQIIGHFLSILNPQVRYQKMLLLE